MRKAAKVYEAGESVEGAKPKVVYESHKKCTPGEFGAQVKEALEKSANVDLNSVLNYKPPEHFTNAALMAFPLATAGAGALGAAAFSDKKNRTRNALRGALLGGGIGGGMSLGYKLTHNPTAKMLAHQQNRLSDADAINREATDLVTKTEKILADIKKPTPEWLLARVLNDDASRKFVKSREENIQRTENIVGGMKRDQAKMEEIGHAMRDFAPKKTQTDSHVRGIGYGALGGVLGGAGATALNATYADEDSTGKKKKEKQAAQPWYAKALAGLGGVKRVSGAGTPQLLAPGSVTSAAPSWLRNNQAVARGLDPKTGLRPGAVAPPPPPVPTAPKMTISPAEAAAGRAKMVITPAQAAAATPPPKSPGLRTPDPAMRQPLGSEGWGRVPAPMIKTQSAREFGQKVAFNFNSIDWNALKTPAMGGAALGAGLGGLAGLINPGEDENGKTRSRFGAMLRGALGGGAMGGLGGAAAGHFAPGQTNDLINKLRYQYTMRTPVPTQAQARTRQNFNAAGEEPFAEDGMVNPAMQAAQG